MKVCAHIALGPWNWEYRQFNTVREARQYFQEKVAGVDFGTGTGEQVMDLNRQCDDCNDNMTFHDYPESRYEVGPTRAIRKTIM